MSFRHAFSANRDRNEPEIIEALRKVGALVARISGEGVPDLLVSFRRKPFFLEVKEPKGKLTPAQKKWHELWRGSPVHIVHTPEEALMAIGAIRPECDENCDDPTCRSHWRG